MYTSNTISTSNLLRNRSTSAPQHREPATHCTSAQRAYNPLHLSTESLQPIQCPTSSKRSAVTLSSPLLLPSSPLLDDFCLPSIGLHLPPVAPPPTALCCLSFSTGSFRGSDGGWPVRVDVDVVWLPAYMCVQMRVCACMCVCGHVCMPVRAFKEQGRVWGERAR